MPPGRGVPARDGGLAVPAIILRQVRDALNLGSGLHDDFVKQTTRTINKIAERDGPEAVADGLRQMADQHREKRGGGVSNKPDLRVVKEKETEDWGRSALGRDILGQDAAGAGVAGPGGGPGR